ncbi:MAG: hypothetical protein BRC47_13150 [Cyanobacteria bacterium QS_7_48_42]|nr:MAG: hypothetical protein BRC47_13150 [Cyanobacteria bacterium QS_7_48_42]
MLSGKLTKSLPVHDLVPTSLLIVGDCPIVPSFLLSFQSPVQGVAANVQPHLAHVFFASPLLTTAIAFFPHVITVRGWHGYSIATLLLPLHVLMQFRSAITND